VSSARVEMTRKLDQIKDLLDALTGALQSKATDSMRVKCT